MEAAIKVLAALAVLMNVAAAVASTKRVACQHPVVCPCGSTGRNVTFCTKNEREEDICGQWSDCRTCRDGLDGCLECLEGSRCSKGSDAPTLVRRKRQYYVRPRHRPHNRPMSSSYTRAGGDCPELRSPKYGSIRCMASDRQRTCVGTCLPGYTFEGLEQENEITLTCAGGSRYTPLDEFPPCRSGGHCDLVVRGAGSFNCTTGMDGTRCDVLCGGSSYITRYFCYPGRPWEPPLPRCVRPKGVTGAERTCPCQNGGTCDSYGNCVCPGDRTGRLCETAVRVRVTCDDPGFVQNGIRWKPGESLVSDRRTFEEGESVVFSCDDDYALKGTPLLTCQSDGTWSNKLPQCVRTATPPAAPRCGDPGQIANGFRRNPDQSAASVRRAFEEGESVIYGCEGGHVLQGTPQISCRSNGRWDSPPPQCVVRTTSTSTTPAPSSCPDPGIDVNGSRRPRVAPRSGFPEGASLEYECNAGYTLQGERTLVCLEGGQWLADRPRCRRQRPANSPTRSCPDPGVDPEGTRHPRLPPRAGRFPVGSRVEYECREGHTLEGERSIRCQPDGRWTSTAPSCEIQSRRPDVEPIYCLNPGSIPDGLMAYRPPLDPRQRGQPEPSLDDPEFPDGGRIEYSCEDGYVLEGSRSLICERTGEWSADPPVCRREDPPVVCSDPGVDRNGDRDPPRSNRRGFPPGSRLEYSCLRGYVLDGQRSLSCLPSGEWSAERPSCDPDTVRLSYCPNPGPIANGRMAFSPALDSRQRTDPRTNLDDPEFPLGGRLSYMCNSGYLLEGSDSITCGRSGQWSEEPPICRRDRIPYCPNPGAIDNGRVTYVPSLDERRRPRPSIQSFDGEDLEYPRGSRLQYSCEPGYSLRGENNITCEPTGQWSWQAPTCITTDVVRMMYCPNPGPILFGIIRFFSPDLGPRTSGLASEDTPEYPEGTTLQYECYKGYVVEGAQKQTCLSSGAWVPPLPPRCIPDCGRSLLGTTRKIANGTRVDAGEWPWVVAITVRRNRYDQLICGGAVLDSQTIITAAHCLTRGGPFTLHFGKHHRENHLDDANVENRTSDKILIHPDFRNSTLDSDIALVTFKRKINFSPYIQPICLPTAETTAKNLRAGKSGYVTGWGVNEKQAPSQELMVAHLPFMNHSACLRVFREDVRENVEPTLTQNMFCSGFADSRQATCSGDSGSPLVFFDPVRERFTLEGLVSLGVMGQCRLPSVFTKVFRFLPWIYSNTS